MGWQFDEASMNGPPVPFRSPHWLAGSDLSQLIMQEVSGMF